MNRTVAIASFMLTKWGRDRFERFCNRVREHVEAEEGVPHYWRGAADFDGFELVPTDGAR